MKAFITGGAGFIGSNLTDRLLQNGHEVRVYDNLSTGQLRFLDDAKNDERFSFVEGDLLDEDTLSKAMEGFQMVFWKGFADAFLKPSRGFSGNPLEGF